MKCRPEIRHVDRELDGWVCLFKSGKTDSTTIWHPTRFGVVRMALQMHRRKLANQLARRLTK